MLEAKEKLRIKSNSASLAGERVAFLAENSYDYVGISPSLLSAIGFDCTFIEELRNWG